MEGAVRNVSENAGNSEEEQEWKEQWGRAGMEGAVRKSGIGRRGEESRNGRSSEEEQEWREQ